MLKKDSSSKILVQGEDIQKLAKLSRINLGKKDITEFSKQLSSILGYVNKIQNYKFTADKLVEDNKISQLRVDKVEKFSEEKIIEQFSEQENNLLKVKKIL